MARWISKIKAMALCGAFVSHALPAVAQTEMPYVVGYSLPFPNGPHVKSLRHFVCKRTVDGQQVESVVYLLNGNMGVERYGSAVVEVIKRGSETPTETLHYPKPTDKRPPEIFVSKDAEAAMRVFDQVRYDLWSIYLKRGTQDCGTPDQGRYYIAPR